MRLGFYYPHSDENVILAYSGVGLFEDTYSRFIFYGNVCLGKCNAPPAMRAGAKELKFYCASGGAWYVAYFSLIKTSKTTYFLGGFAPSARFWKFL